MARAPLLLLLCPKRPASAPPPCAHKCHDPLHARPTQLAGPTLGRGRDRGPGFSGWQRFALKGATFAGSDDGRVIVVVGFFGFLERACLASAGMRHATSRQGCVCVCVCDRGRIEVDRN